MASESDHPKIEENDLNCIEEYVQHIFINTPLPAGSQPLILEGISTAPLKRVSGIFGSNTSTLTELDVFRVLGMVLTHGITRMYADNSNKVHVQLMTTEHLEHIRKCFQATGYDFLLDPSPLHPLIRKCLPTGGPAKCLKIPKNPTKTEFLTVLFLPIQPIQTSTSSTSSIQVTGDL